MNQKITTHETQGAISYGYALRMFLGWAILYMGSLIGFIELIRHNII